MFFGRSKANRPEQLSSLASKLEMQFESKDEFGLVKRLGDFRLFKKNGKKKMLNLMINQNFFLSTKVIVFDLEIRDDDNGEYSKQTVFFVESKELSLPHFFIRPEEFFDRVGKFLRLTDEIEFEEHPEFCKSYWVVSDDEALVRRMVTDDFARFFSIEKKWRLEGLNYYMIFYQNGKLFSPNEIEQFYKKGVQIYEELKNKK